MCIRLVCVVYDVCMCVICVMYMVYVCVSVCVMCTQVRSCSEMIRVKKSYSFLLLPQFLVLIIEHDTGKNFRDCLSNAGRYTHM